MYIVGVQGFAPYPVGDRTQSQEQYRFPIFSHLVSLGTQKYGRIFSNPIKIFNFVGVQGFEPWVFGTQNQNVSRYTTLRIYES